MQPAPFLNNPTLVFILLAWSLVWKGFGLWRAARLEQRNWFIAMLVISTPGVIEIIYLFFFARKRLRWPEVKGWFKR